MEIRLAQVFGFCEGVEKAIEKAERETGRQGKVHTLGELIHNPMEINRLEGIGVNAIETLNELPEGETVLIRAHGIRRDDLKAMKQNYRVVDATCPLVTKVQRAALKESQSGRTVILYGNPNHPEVKGVVSYADRYRVVYTLDDLKVATKELASEPVAILSQTTANVEHFQEACDYLLANHPDAVVRNTICYATVERQEAVDALAREVNAVLVIGGPNSSNTKQLAAVAKKHCERVYLLESAEDIDPAWLSGVDILGVTAGASTPQWIIDQVIAKAKNLGEAA